MQPRARRVLGLLTLILLNAAHASQRALASSRACRLGADFRYCDFPILIRAPALIPLAPGLNFGRMITQDQSANLRLRTRSKILGTEPSITGKDFGLSATLTTQMRGLINASVKRFNLNLEMLEGITIFADYAAGAANFDTGMEGVSVSASTGSTIGVGMTPLVIRGGSLQCHILLPKHEVDAAFAAVTSSASRKAQYTIVHELAHTDDHHNLTREFADALKDVATDRDILNLGSRASWSEYYVCRTVADEYPELIGILEEMVVRAFETFVSEAQVAAYQAASGDREEGKRHAISAGFNLILPIARLLGHLDGLGLTFQSSCRMAPAYFNDLVKQEDIDTIHKAFVSLWEARGHWPALSEVRIVWTTLSPLLNRIGSDRAIRAL